MGKKEGSQSDGEKLAGLSIPGFASAVLPMYMRFGGERKQLPKSEILNTGNLVELSWALLWNLIPIPLATSVPLSPLRLHRSLLCQPPAPL